MAKLVASLFEYSHGREPAGNLAVTLWTVEYVRVSQDNCIETCIFNLRIWFLTRTLYCIKKSFHSLIQQQNLEIVWFLFCSLFSIRRRNSFQICSMSRITMNPSFRLFF